MPRWSKISLWLIAAIIGLMLLSMLIVPWQLKQQGSAWIAENTSRALTIEKVFFNPFTLSLDITGVSLTEPDAERTFVSLARLQLSLALRSLIDQAVIIDQLELDQPFVNLELLAAQKYNFSDFTQLGGEPGEAEVSDADGPLHFSLNNIIIRDGSIDFSDLTLPKQARHRIRELNLAVPFVGNVPYLVHHYVKPRLSLLLNGSEVVASGELKPFHESLETSLNFSINDLDLPFYADRSPIPLPLEVEQGSLDLELDLNYRVSVRNEPELLLNGVIALSDLALNELDGRPLLKLPDLLLQLERAALFQQDYQVSLLELQQPELFVDRDNNGLWNFQRIMAAVDGSTSAPEQQPVAKKETATPLPLVLVDSLQLQGARINFQDDFVPGGFSERIDNLNLELRGLSTHPQQQTAAELALRTGRELALAIDGSFGLNPASADLRLQAGQLGLQALYPYFQSFLTEPIGGRLEVNGQILYSEAEGVRINQADLTLFDLAVPFGQQDHLLLPQLRVSDSALDLSQRTLALGTIVLTEGDVQLSRLLDGSLSPQQLLLPNRDQTAAAETETDSPARPWQIQAERLELAGFKVNYRDFQAPRQPQLSLRQLDFVAHDLSYPEASSSPFELALQVGRQGTLDVSGSAAHSPLRLSAKSHIKGLDLPQFNNFLPALIQVKLEQGRLSSSLDLTLEQQPERLTGSFSGQLNVADFRLHDPVGQGALLSWGGLNIEGIQGELAPFALHLKDVALSDYQANIEISKEGRINLTSVTAAETATAEQAEAPAKTPEEPGNTAEKSGPPPDIRIDALTLQGGTVAFVDRSMTNTFSATMYELGGRVTGLASAEDMRADVDLRGQLENHSPLTVSGTINPLSRDLFADLTISFKDIDLTPMTPYSGTYLGYAIGKGKLYLDLNYHIEQRTIAASNQILLDQFTLGESMASDKATKLPVGLAIALLKDTNGEIHLDVPVRGDLNDPEFSVTGVIFTVIKNLLVKAATSPFALLSSMLGGDEDISSVAFEPGSARLSATQQDKLNKLAEMLSKRPNLNLEISAFVDPKKDPESYRRRQLEQALVQLRSAQLPPSAGAPAALENLPDEEYASLVLELYQQAEFPKPREADGTLTELPTAEMEKLLLANIIVGDVEMQALAQQRANAVRDALVNANEAIKPRLFLQSVELETAPEKGPASRVEFSISAK
mgnify:CR=1 FL=1